MNKTQQAASALKWIVAAFEKQQIPFQVTGGLAAIAYGAKRPLVDIDFDFPEDRFADILKEVEKYVTFGPAQFKDAHWDLQLMTLSYEGQDIDLGGAYHAKIFDPAHKNWVHAPVDFSRAVQKNLLGIDVPVMPKEDLIRYKSILARDVDLLDIEQIAAAGIKP